MFGFRVAGVSPAALTGNAAAGVSDLSILLGHFGTTQAGPSDGDIDGDHDVDLTDLSALLAVFGSGC